MAAGDYIIPGAQAISQWGIGFVNACGEAALAVVQGIQNGIGPSAAGLINLVKQAPAFGTAVSGTSTPNELTALAAANGVPLARGTGASALSTINTNLTAGVPTILEVQHAQAFGGTDSNVSGHYVTVVGKAANGNYIVADSNQAAAKSGGFVQYTANQIMNAQPFATLTPTKAPNPIAGLLPGGLVPSNPLGGLFSSFNTTPQDFAWRAGLIVGGMILIVLGLVVFFSHQEGQATTVITEQAGKAAKSAATAAAAA